LSITYNKPLSIKGEKLGMKNPKDKKPKATGTQNPGDFF
jgi:hypothetical protein